MGSIYRPTYTDRHGERKQAKTWRIAYTDEAGQRRTVGGYKDKKATLEKLRQLEQRVDRLRAGLPVEGEGAAPEKVIEDALVAWQAELRMLGRTADYIKAVAVVVRWAARDCRWRTLADIKADAFGSFLAALSAEGRADNSVNAVRDRSSFFCNYCVRQGWLAANPLAKVKRANRRCRPRRRRAFTPDELQRVLSCTTRLRSMILFAALTGLRRHELRALQKRDVVWHPSPRLHLRPEATKSRRADKLPLLPEAADVIRPLWDRAERPTDRLFPGLRCGQEAFAEIVRRAGVAKRDADGRQVDFHSLRYYHCTRLARRLPIQIVSRLMRHRKISLTNELYTDLGIDQLAEDVSALGSMLADLSAPITSKDAPAPQRMPA